MNFSPTICLIVIVFVVNLLTFMLFAIDKFLAIRHKNRIAEATLLWWCFLGGAIGGWLAMSLCRHKTKHLRFTIGVPLCFLLHLILLLALLYMSHGFVR